MEAFLIVSEDGKMHTRWIKEVKHTKIKQLTMEAQQAFNNTNHFVSIVLSHVLAPDKKPREYIISKMMQVSS